MSAVASSSGSRTSISCHCRRTWKGSHVSVGKRHTYTYTHTHTTAATDLFLLRGAAQQLLQLRGMHVPRGAGLGHHLCDEMLGGWLVAKEGDEEEVPSRPINGSTHEF